MTRLPRHALLALGALLAAPAAVLAAGPGAIEGVVVDGSGAPLAAGVRVTITCGAVKKTATLDRGGGFSVTGLPAGTCTVSGQGAGFATVALTVTVADDAIASVMISMRPPAPEVTMAPMAPAPMAGAGGAPPMVAPARAPAPRDRAAPAEEMRAAAPPRPPPPPPRVVRLDDARAPIGKQANRRVAADRGRDLDDVLIAQDGGGFAPVRVFPVPQYTAAYDGPRTDFRETIYWNPTVTTDARGEAEVTFVTSDAVTAFRATAEGFATDGTPGAGQVALQSKLPLTLDAHLPVEVTAGDRIRLPITLTNQTEAALDATLATRFGSAFKLTGAAATTPIHLRAGEKRSMFFALEVVATGGDAEVALAVTARGLADEVRKTIRVVPRGFPFEVSAAGTASGGHTARAQLDLTGALPGSITATVTMYPSALASMTKGMEGMIREPGGCFEQTSSSNYPNVMVLAYLASSDDADPALVERSQAVLDRGYGLLTGYETKQRGYEWFGQTPGHEALTAYGLMEFADMARVYDVDPAMVERTAAWLMSRRDGHGGFTRSTTALDSFGRAGEATTNAYIMWALAEAGRADGMTAELKVQRELGATTRDPYLLALTANTHLRARAADGAAMVKRLAAMQQRDGSFTGAKESITMSGDASLTIETTALAILAMLQAGDAYQPQVRAAVDYLNANRGGYGEWSNTQATILGLKALTAYAEASKQMAADGAATVIVNGRPAGTIQFERGRKDALVWDDLAGALRPGPNTIEVKLDSAASLPYSIAIAYRAAQPQSSPAAKVAVATTLLADHVRMGEGVTLRAQIDNTTDAGVPMTLARIGIPGGLVFQTWQLKELRDQGKIDFYETGPREVILYWRALPPSAHKQVDLNLLAAVPGTYEAPASSAYLYYTDEDKRWAPAVAVTVAE
ncbi:MAG: carboxypeptidase regulatory-like domain-containing protein [Myxococcales bacterium]|nr:carboxypeptidase regulatory-like domain-containing protein [Myxococcales bacterium]